MTEDDKIIEGLALGKNISQISDLSADEYANELIKRTTRSESVNFLEGYSEVGSNTLVPNF